jgi:hypothetical protein
MNKRRFNHQLSGKRGKKVVEKSLKSLARPTAIAKQPAKLTFITQAPRLSDKCLTER